MKSTSPTPINKPKAKEKSQVSTATKNPVVRNPTTRSLRSKKTATGTTAERMRAMIAEEAFLLAERRNFQNGDPVSDWLAAEQEITHRLTLGSGSIHKS